MAISETDVDALTDWSTAQTLKAAKTCRMNILLGHAENEFDGRKWKRTDLARLNTIINELEQITLADSNGQMVARARFGRQG